MQKTPSLIGMLIRLALITSFALYIFTGFVFDIFDINFDKRDLKYSILFEHATGVESNTQLEMSGFNVGHVISIKHIKHNGKTKAKIEVVVNKKYKEVITDKVHFFIARRKFIGLTFIQLIPVLEGKILKDGAIIEGVSPPRYSLLFTRSKDLLVMFNKFLEKSHFNEILKEYASIIKETKLLKAEVNKKLPNLKKNSKKLIKDIAKLKKVYLKEEDFLMKNSKEIFLTTENFLKTKKKRIITTLDKSSDISEKLIDLKDDSLILVKNDKDNVLKIIKNIEQSIKKIEKLQTKVEKLTDSFDVGVGNIGLFLNDKEIYDYSRFIMKIIKQESYRYFLPIKHKVGK